MSKGWKAALILVAVVCFAVALSYPIQYSLEQKENNEGMARLAALREAGRRRAEETTEAPEETATPEKTEASEAPTTLEKSTAPEKTESPEPTAAEMEPAPDETPWVTEGPSILPEDTPRAAEQTSIFPKNTSMVTEQPSILPENTSIVTEQTSILPEDTPLRTEIPAVPSAEPYGTDELPEVSTQTPGAVEKTAVCTPEGARASVTPAPAVTAEPTPSPTPTVVPTPTPDRRLRTGKAQPYPEKEKVVFDEADILPEFQELYGINSDLVGWITIPDTVIDYPVVQSADSEFYLKHDFYGEENSNGQIILDAKCDPYTPSYNLVVSGHNMKSGSMFGSLVNYSKESYWKKHKTLQLDVLTEHREYVVFAAFFSADYDVDEEGFRYNVDIQYRLDMETWLEEIRANQLYETGVEVEFGDEFLTLTTCNRWRRKDGRFVLVGRRIREGEEIE